MSEQLAASLFEESTAMYSQGNYSVCLALLNDCIYLEPNISTLYSNRAISNFSLKQIENAMADLTKSIEINHLNYVAYFNLFSLNFLQSNSEEAFKNLCFSISSIYTALARHERKLDWLEKAIFYSYNNKQSIFLKAIDHLQNNKLQDSLKLLNDAFGLQTNPENKIGIHQTINVVQNSLGREASQFFAAQQIDNSPFKLMTDVSCPYEAEYDKKIQDMLKEFNGLNKLIHYYQQENIRQMNPSTEKSIQTSDKMEKQTNCKTIYESNVKEEKPSQEECLFSREGRVDKLNLYSTISEGANEQDEQIYIKINSYDLYPLNENKTVCIYIEQAIIYNAEIEPNHNNLYGVFHYMSDKSEITIRTGHQKIKEGLCRWSQWSQVIQLSQNPSKMSFTLFSKNFTSFDDKIIGKGEFILDSLGYNNIQFKNCADQQAGKLEIIVERAS